MDSPVCIQCFPRHVYLGDPVLNLHLIKWKGDYHLVRPDPHDQIVMSFKFPPTPMPPEDDDNHEEFMAWIELTRAEEIVPMEHEEAHAFVQRCIDLGYNPDEHGFLRCWLADKAGQLLAKRGS
jgi:hypothetical protein